ncbi:MAG TPA: preprotein translocase subunit YajC [Thermoanaerobaculia bacterium]|nr:preprotein translocase subunit YajC [Thermoanaerobaculia bacterium]
MSILPLLLAQAAQPQPSAWMSFVPMLLILLVFYFLMIAPMRKRQKQMQAMLDSLQKGDRVVTSGGLHGEVAGLEGPIVHLKVADQVKVKVSKSAISQREDRGSTS